MGGFALARLGEIPPTPLYQGGILSTDKLLVNNPEKQEANKNIQ